MPGRKLITRHIDHFPAVRRRATTGGGPLRETRLVIEGNAYDSEAVLSAIREWIVPVLVREFLAERSATAGSLAPTSMQQLDTGSIGEEQRVSPATNQ